MEVTKIMEIMAIIFGLDFRKSFLNTGCGESRLMEIWRLENAARIGRDGPATFLIVCAYAGQPPDVGYFGTQNFLFS